MDRLYFCLVFIALFFISPAIAVTDGWEDVNPARKEFPPADVAWEADLSGPEYYSIEKRNGAAGYFSVQGGRLRIVKTNKEGFLVLKGKPFKTEKDAHLRMFADVEVVADNPDCSLGFLRAYGSKENLCRDFAAEKGNFSSGGSPSMIAMRNSAPNTPYRKYAHFIAKEGIVTPVIVIGGPPSQSIWGDWTFERVEAAQKEWAKEYAAKTTKDNSSAMIDESAFDRILAGDVHHTAEVKTIDGVSRLLVDGKMSLPVAYAARGKLKDPKVETFHGDALEKAGVKLMVRGISMGGKNGSPSCYWTKKGFDAVGAVEDFKNAMRVAPESLFIVRLSCNAYPDYTKEHPEEIWKTEDGRTVCGTSGSCVIGYDSMGVPDTNRWPWVSYSSRRWRDDVKSNIRKLVAEFKRQGLDKRIVGIHLCGYHDGQFSAPYPDYSQCAKREYEEYLAGRPVYTNYLYFVKQCGFRAQEEFAREFKNVMGKKTIAIRGCMGMFSGGSRGNYDITAFANSDAIDIIVPQPSYERRHPALSLGAKLPQSSFDMHGKMFWYEFDVRTYGALESWASSVVSTKGLGQQDDIVAWRSAYRKLAGLMMSLRSGFWFYDMGGGWYSPEEISSDIAGSIRDMKTFALRSPSKWRADVAVVIDEANTAVLGNRADRSLSLRTMVGGRDSDIFSASGVPYEMYLAEDVLDDASVLKDKKMVVLSLFRAFDDRRMRFVKRLMSEGKTIVFLAESGVAGGDVEATGFKTVFDRKNRRHKVVAAEGTAEDCANPLSAMYEGVYCDGNKAIGPRVTVEEAPGVKVVARYSEDGAPAVAYREDGGCRRIYVAEHHGFVPALFNRFAREAGAYVPHAGTGIQVDMNGDFISIHALRSGHFEFKLPFATKAVNMKSGKEEPQWNGTMALELTAGETCWFRLDPPEEKKECMEEGWKSSPSNRRLSDPSRPVLWRAPFGCGLDSFTVEKRFEADGRVFMEGNALVIDKTNDLGVIVVKPKKPYVAAGERLLRTAVKVECKNAKPLETRGAVYLYGAQERLSTCKYDWVHWGTGEPRNSKVLNTPDGVGEWKYGYDVASATNGYEMTPAIVVGGKACKTTWSDWRIEDCKELDKEWNVIAASKRPRDKAADAVSLEKLQEIVAQDHEHTAKVEVRNGRSVLLVDGIETDPVLYKSRKDKSGRLRWAWCCHAGKGMLAAGVKLQVLPVGRHWWANEQYGTDFAVTNVTSAMRTAPDAFFVLGINLNPYDQFALKHPSERWIGRGGMIVCGGGGACKKAVKPGEPWPKGMLPCTSYSSELWRNTAKRNIGLLVAELRRLGLSKRIVGVHLTGFHDGQFSTSDFPDFSPSALASYRRHTGNPNATIPDFTTAAVLKENGDEEQKRWLEFIKREPCRVLNDIARHTKKCFGKDIVAIRWSYGPFSGKYINDYDTHEFLRSDALDILVAQHTYGNRTSAIPFANKIPLATYHRHGKMYVDEFDFRTWSTVNFSDMGLMGLGCSTDLPMWKSAIRRAAGRMIAGEMGWWFYDMENGWFDHPAILADISDMLNQMRKIPCGEKRWTPSAAVVIDEENILQNVNLARRTDKGGAATYRSRSSAMSDLNYHLPKFAASGVPHDVVLAEEIFADPSLADRYKTIFWTCCVRKGDKHRAFEKMFRDKGRGILFRDGLCASTAESLNSFARNSGAYVPIARSGLQIDMKDGFISVHCIIPGHYDFKLPYPAKVSNLKTGKEIKVTGNGMVLPLDMEAGESRWYSFVSIDGKTPANGK
ncbi:MAG: hypothetical protein J6R18_04245 [Kiritimatiellae bacterium]|nr:hypothetical protein [Kiritimatiellia bacterium]